MATAAKEDDLEAIDDVDNPELTETDFARGVPFSEAHPELLKMWKKQGGRPTINEMPKVHVGFRLAADVVNHLKASGKGYGARVESVLRDAIARGVL